MAGQVVMLLGGDVHVQRPEPMSMFEHVAPTLREADIVFGNLEGVLSGPVPPRVGNGHLRSDPGMVTAYTSAGFSVLGFGNHGCTCCGAEALLDCLSLLEKEGIGHAGAGRNLEEARRPCIVERNGVRVAFLAYSCLTDPKFHATAGSPGVAAVRARTSYEFPNNGQPGGTPVARTQTYSEDLAMIIEDVQRAKAEADVVVTTWHWGLGPLSNGPMATRVMEYQTELAHAAIDHGCDIVAGHHTHVLGAVEVYKGKPIFYSLGNFAFDYLNDPENASKVYRGIPRGQRTSFALGRCVIEGGSLREVSLVPYRIPPEDPRPVFVGTQDGRDIVELAQDVSEDFGTQLRPRGGDVLVMG